MSISPTPFTSILVANRGEIARRVFATARTMGMRCIAVYIDADANAPFVGDADESVRLTTSQGKSTTYLDRAAILAAAELTGAQAIHPGYGFLSENAEFAQEVADAGLVWVGPAPTAIATMGDKIEAKRVAVAANVPTLPSSESADTAAAASVGFPLLVKAAAGGGGKGMRLVESPDEFDAAVAAAKREALNGFGDDRVFLERYVKRARHIEIQILGDQHGEVVHLGERECSIQRRHQKVIEEAPSPAVSPALRTAMGEAALGLASAIGYYSTGTVEFLLDDDSGEFFFLEVNTRLQVEHPVTEAVTGIDLVREQLRVAAGESLGYQQSSIHATGHAIQARLYAEDPANDFLPQIGRLDAFEPASTPALRWDFGVEHGSVVGVEFDPMLGKVIAHGPTRSEAAGQLALGLERLHLGGITTNRDFLAATLRTPEFLAGDTTTDFIERVEIHDGVTAATSDPQTLRFAAIAAALWLQEVNRANAGVLARTPSGWRNGPLPMERTVLAVHDQEVEVTYRRGRDGSFSIGDGSGCGPGRAVIYGSNPQSIDLAIDERRQQVRITQCGDQFLVQTPTTTLTLSQQPRFAVPGDDGPTSGLAAPMPGSVLNVEVAPGDTVVAGQVVMVLEAMKMEHPITAPRDGEIAEVRVVQGQQVELDFVLMVMADELGESDE